MTTASLLKYHGLGNDFLIALGPRSLGDAGLDRRELAKLLCDRRRGVGADGFMVAEATGEGATKMTLYNSDGSTAETSGNGLRCLALALVDSGSVSSRSVLLETAAGGVVAEVTSRGEDGSAMVTVPMGRAAVGPPETPPQGGLAARRVETGNPHLVLYGEAAAELEMAVIGPRLEKEVPEGQNVEAVAPDGEGGLHLVVWERGAGLTRACGSGSCAAAAALRADGLVGDEVVVHNPGGDLLVILSGEKDRPELSLKGPAARVARVEVDLSSLSLALAAR